MLDGTGRSLLGQHDRHVEQKIEKKSKEKAKDRALKGMRAPGGDGPWPLCSFMSTPPSDMGLIGATKAQRLIEIRAWSFPSHTGLGCCHTETMATVTAPEAPKQPFCPPVAIFRGRGGQTRRRNTARVHHRPTIHKVVEKDRFTNSYSKRC